MIRSRALLLIFLTVTLATGLRGGGKPDFISGKVRSITGKPLPDVEIRLLNGNGTTWSDPGGFFQIDLGETRPPLIIRATKAGFHDQQLRISQRNLRRELVLIMTPLSYLKEEVNVTALNEREEAWKLPFSSETISYPLLEGSQNNNLATALQQETGLNFVGKGGFTTTPSIRGLARQRVLLLFNGARLSADRNAGVSGTAIPLELAEKIEIVKSAASVIYGSDAMGGVVNFFPELPVRENFSGRLNLSFASNSELLNPGLKLNYKKRNLYFSAYYQYKHSGNYSSPEGEVLNSGYKYSYLWLNFGYDAPRTSLAISWLHSAGRDIGRPDRANAGDPRNTYPFEKSDIMQLTFLKRGFPGKNDLRIQLFLTPTSYSLEKRTPSRTEISDSSSLDGGVKVTLLRQFPFNLKLQLGFDHFLRGGVEMENRSIRGEMVSTHYSLRNGERHDSGIFATIDFAGVRNLDILAGGRYSWLYTRGTVEERLLEKRAENFSAFLSFSYQFTPNWSSYGNYSSAFRLPTFIEAFYIGISARGNTYGNPGLEQETSRQYEAGIRFRNKRLQSSLALFRNRVGNMIEKIQINATTSTYANLTRAEIAGFELTNSFWFFRNLEIGANFCYILGKDPESDAPVNDIPPARLQLLMKHSIRKMFWELNLLHSFAFDRPGPAEAAIDAFTSVSLKAGYFFNSSLTIQLRIDNLLDQLYYANPDPDIPYEKGIDLNLQLTWLF